MFFLSAMYVLAVVVFLLFGHSWLLSIQDYHNEVTVLYNELRSYENKLIVREEKMLAFYALHQEGDMK